jgi:hypothetical protein
MNYQLLGQFGRWWWGAHQLKLDATMLTPPRPLRYSTPAVWAFERIVEKGGDNPADGAKQRAQPKAFIAPFFETANAGPSNAAGQRP